MNKFVIIIFLLLGIVMAADKEFNGFVDTYHTMSFKNEQYNSSRTRMRGELYTYEGNASFFVSFNAINNNVTEASKVDLREIYLEYIGNNWDARLGKQIIVWGKADGLRITDIICPGDYSEFIARDFDDIRIPVEVAKLRYMHDVTTFELLWLPFFEPTILPGSDNPWGYSVNYSDNYVIEDAVTPEKKLNNSEIAGKVSFYMSGFDFAMSYFHTWDDNAVYQENSVGDSVYITPKYHRLDFVGLEMNKPLGDFVLRAETAVYQGKHLATSSNDLMKKNLVKMMMGLDWYPGGDWTFSAQLSNDLILDYDDDLSNDQNEVISTLNISRKLLRQTLQISNMVYWGITGNDLYDRVSVDYAMNDNLHLLCGIDYFGGDDSGSFGYYKDNSQLWLKAKFSF